MNVLKAEAYLLGIGVATSPAAACKRGMIVEVGMPNVGTFMGTPLRPHGHGGARLQASAALSN